MKYVFTLIKTPPDHNRFYDFDKHNRRKEIIKILSNYKKEKITFMRAYPKGKLTSGGDFHFGVKEYYGSDKRTKNPFRLQIYRDFIKDKLFVGHHSCSVVGRIVLKRQEDAIVISNNALTLSITHKHSLQGKVFFKVHIEK